MKEKDDFNNYIEESTDFDKEFEKRFGSCDVPSEPMTVEQYIQRTKEMRKFSEEWFKSHV